MTFASPLVLLALLVIPLGIAAAGLLRRRRARHAVGFTNLGILASVAETRRRGRVLSFAPLALLLLAAATAVAGAAGPRLTTSVTQRRSVVVLLVDVSSSMDATDVKPSRILASVAAMKGFVSRLPSTAELGLVEFGTDAQVVDYPTVDHRDVVSSVAYLSPNGATALGDGLSVAVALIDGLHGGRSAGEGGTSSPGVVVLLSDGAQTAGTVLPTVAAERAKAEDIPVDTIAFGTRGGTMRYPGYPNPIPVPPDPATMRAIARITGGHSFTATTAAQIAGVFEKLGSTVGRSHGHRAISSWFALTAGALLAFAVLLGRSFASPLE